MPKRMVVSNSSIWQTVSQIKMLLSICTPVCASVNMTRKRSTEIPIKQQKWSQQTIQRFTTTTWNLWSWTYVETLIQASTWPIGTSSTRKKILKLWRSSHVQSTSQMSVSQETILEKALPKLFHWPSTPEDKTLWAKSRCLTSQRTTWEEMESKPYLNPLPITKLFKFLT